MDHRFGSTLFDCCNDIDICLYTCFCPCCQNGSNIAKIRSEDCGLFHVCCSFSPFWVHQMIKENKKISKRGCDDCLVYTFCCCFGICQDSRELKNVL